MNSQFRSQFRLLKMRLQKRLVNIVCRQLYQDNNNDIHQSILLAGVARSGTTWLADLIRSQIHCRVMWEPFNPHKNPSYNRFPDFLYKRPGDSDPDLLEYTTQVLSGNIRHKWVDREVDGLLYDSRLVKDVRINLFLFWLHEKFPTIPMIFLIRHPCSVVLSRIVSGWDSDADIASFLSQEMLVNDFLSTHIEFIQRADSIESKHAIIWAIQNLVPLKQFKNSNLNILFYEDLCINPHSEIPKIFHVIGHRYKDSIFQLVDRPSRTVKRTSSVLTGEDKISKWKREMSCKQIQDVLSVVEEFGLNYLYGSSLTPLFYPSI